MRILAEAQLGHQVPDATGRQGRRPGALRQRAALSGLVAGALVLAGGVSAVLHARWASTLLAEQRLAEQVTELESLLDRTLGRVDVYLQGLAATMDGSPSDQPPTVQRGPAILARSAAMSDLDSLLALDVEGNLIAASAPLPSTGAALHQADRDDFRALRRLNSADLRVGWSDQTLMTEAVPSLTLSRRIVDPEGHFRGMIAAEMRFDRLLADLRSRGLGGRETASLAFADGRFITFPRAYSAVRRPDSVLPAAVTSELVQLSRRSEEDGSEWLEAKVQVGSLPLSVVVGVPLAEIEAEWHRRAGRIALLTLVTLLCIAAAVLAMRRRGGTRTPLAIVTTDEPPSPTDPLTGLASRHWITTEIERLWQQAGRDSTPLSLLLLDIDHLYAFGQRVGRTAGDDVLVRIASSAMSLLYQSDVGGRFNDDEIVLVLPGTDADGAATVAEMLRSAVEDLNIAHASSPKGRVTVSIGWTSIVPNEGQQCELLLSAARRGVDEGKRGGRNRAVGIMIGANRRWASNEV